MKSAAIRVTTLVRREGREGSPLYVQIGSATRGSDGTLLVHLEALPAQSDLVVHINEASWGAGEGAPGWAERPHKDSHRLLDDWTTVSVEWGFCGASAVAGAVDIAMASPGRIVTLLATDGIGPGSTMLAQVRFGVVPRGHELAGALCVAMDGSYNLLRDQGAMIAPAGTPAALMAVEVALRLLGAANNPKATIFQALEPA